MSRASLTTFICALLLGGSAAAHESTTIAPGQRPGSKPAVEQTAKPSAEPAPAATAAREPAGQPINVKLELTITDQTGRGDPAKKTVTMIIADRYSGSIRSMGNSVQARLNVDATPQILPNGSVKVQLGLEYNPRQASPIQSVKTAGGDTLQMPEDQGGSSLNQRVWIVLEPGKPVILSQAADPISDRKITVEVRVTVLR
jgi:hypothetical protein